jgi:hypothetical protein
MSWVTDVILIFSLEEEYDDDEEFLDSVPALDNINAWLEENGYGILVDIGEFAGGGKAMQTNVYGGAFNFLKIDAFIKLVKAQPWREPENVQLLIQDEEESRFTLHTIIGD